MDLFELTRRLIDIESTTGQEHTVGLFLETYLIGQGFTVKLQEVEPDRFNVIVSSGQPRVVLSTHMDTVPPFITSSEDEENIYGRGACDAKGIIAAQIKAAEQLRQGGIEDIGLLFVVGEERESEGARLANMLGLGSEFLINGEPTGNKLAMASKGSLRVEILAQGKAAHSAYPEMGESAIETLLDVLADIRQMPLPVHPVLGETNFNIGMISGGVAANVIPDEGLASLMFRLVEGSTTLKADLRAAIGERARMNIVAETPPVFLNTVEGFETTVVSFTTDIPVLDRLGTPYLLGPGSILDAHACGERISKRELTEAVELYTRLVRTLLH